MEYITVVTIVVALIFVMIGMSIDKECPRCGSTTYFMHNHEKKIVECIECSSRFTESSAKRKSEVIFFNANSISVRQSSIRIQP